MKGTTQDYIAQLRIGNIKAYEMLFNQYYPRVQSFALGFTKNPIAAEEIAQNVFFKIWQHRTELIDDLSLNSYIFTIARNEITDYFRAERYAIHYQEHIINSHQPVSYEIEQEYNTKEIQKIADETVETLTEQQRLVYKMSRIEHLSNEEIAIRLNISKRTVEKHLSLALKKLRDAMSDFLFWLFIFFI